MSDADPSSFPPPQPSEVMFGIGDDRYVSLQQYIEQKRLAIPESQIETGLIAANDVIAIQSEDAEGSVRGLTFDITRADWDSTGLYGLPGKRLVGVLDGTAVPEDVKGQEVFFIGSSLGGSSVIDGAFVSECAPVFRVGMNEYKAPFMTGFEVFRPNEEGGLQPRDGHQLAAEAREKVPDHTEHLEAARSLMARFGFGDITDFTHGTDPGGLHYEDETLEAVYEARRAQGNELTILDTQTNQYLRIKYVNAAGQDILKVSCVDLTPDFEVEQAKATLRDSSMIYRSSQSITTFMTSGELGVDLITYEPGKTVSARYLREIAGVTPGEHDSIAFTIENGQVELCHDSAYGYTERSNSGAPERVLEAVRYIETPEGHKVLDIGSNAVQLPDFNINVARYI